MHCRDLLAQLGALRGRHRDRRELLGGRQALERVAVRGGGLAPLLEVVERVAEVAVRARVRRLERDRRFLSRCLRDQILM